MTRTIGWRITGLAVLMTVVMGTVAQAQQPTVVFSIRGIDPLLEDADFIGGEVGHPGHKAQAEGMIDQFTQGKGLAGIDKKKPLGVFWNATADGPPQMPVAFIPVSDAKALQELLKQFAPDLEVEDDVWSAEVNGQAIKGKVSGGYLFISPNLPEKLPDAAKLANSKYDVSLDVSVANIPDHFKDLFLEQTEASGRQAQENSPEPANEAERIGREWGFEAALAILRAVVKESDQLTLGVDVDSKARTGAFDVALTGQASTNMAKVMAAYGKIQPAFAGLGSADAPLRVVVSHPSPVSGEQLDEFSKFAKNSMSEMIAKDERIESDKDREAVKTLGSRVLDVFLSTLKTGALHSGFVLEAGGDKLRVFGGAKVANGDEANKLLDDVLKLAKDKEDAAKVKLDAAKHAGARIHAITIDSDNEAVENFGDEPGHLAFRADSLWFSLGGDNLNALKKALDLKPGTRTSSPISIQVKPAALTILMKGDDEDAIERAKQIAGKPGDKLSVDVLPIANGAKLRLEFGVDLLKLAHDVAE